MSVITAAVMLFLIMDPVGNLPIFLSILRPLPEGRRRKVMIRELLISLGNDWTLDVMGCFVLE